MKNNYGFIYIDLGTQDFSDTDITTSLSEETKKTLSELVNKIDKEYSNNVGINSITKIPYIHLYDIADYRDIKALGSINTTDDGARYLQLNFNVQQYIYTLGLYLSDNELVVELYKSQIQFVE